MINCQKGLIQKLDPEKGIAGIPRHLILSDTERKFKFSVVLTLENMKIS